MTDFSYRNDPRMNLAEGLAAIPQGEDGAASYLGDMAVVDAIIRNLAADISDRQQKVAAGEMQSDEAVRLDFLQAYGTAKIFLGRNSSYAPVPDWHIDSMASGVAPFCVAFYNMVDVETAEDVLVAVMGLFVRSVYEGIQLAADGAPQDRWQTVIDGSIETIVDLMVGLDPNR